MSYRPILQQIMQDYQSKVQPAVTLYKGVYGEDKLEELIAAGAEKVDMYLCQNGDVVFIRQGHQEKEKEKGIEKSIQKPREGKEKIDLKNWTTKEWGSGRWKTDLSLLDDPDFDECIANKILDKASGLR